MRNMYDYYGIVKFANGTPLLGYFKTNITKDDQFVMPNISKHTLYSPLQQQEVPTKKQGLCSTIELSW